MDVKCAFAGKDSLGEGPVWSVEEQALYWVDINGPCLQRWHPATGTHAVWRMPQRIGCFALRQSGDAVVGLESGLAFYDFESGDVTPVYSPEPGLNTRFNDGKCDRNGRFWAGTMDYEATHPIGSLYRLDMDGRGHKIREKVIISNGLGWSPDNRIMYYTDSVVQTIFAYDFDPDTGNISHERVFARDEEGFPDGLTVDSEGYIWGAKWDGWKIVRYAPDGSIDREIELPVQRPTSCIFGGPDLKQLYITTARTGLPEDALASQPLAGSVLVLESAVAGLPEPRFAG